MGWRDKRQTVTGCASRGRRGVEGQYGREEKGRTKEKRPIRIFL